MRQKIQSYEVIEIIGHGGMGIVYKARHEFRKETVAIKSLSHQYVLEPELRKRFRNEAGILDKLDHPNIVKVLDFIEEPDSLNIVMEYVEGRTLDKMIGKEVGPIPYEKALILFEQILRGISYAHQNGVIHRDLKPSNIIVTNDNKIKITDFGIAKVEGSGSHTKTGTKMGTLYYMSPEQIRGERVDERSDIYSLGITLYEMLAGRLPFERKQDTSDFVIMNQIVNEEIKDPREYYPYIPKELVRVIYKAISKEKEKRILSVNNFIDEIKLVKEERKPARIPEVEQKTLIAEKEEPKIIKDVITKDKGKKNNKKNIILAVSLAVLVIIAIAIVWMSVPKDVASSSDGMTIASGSNDKTVKIGEQTWMAENLNTDHYRNGDAIPEVEDPAQWGNLKTGAWCYYDNKPENGKKYGKLYNWYAVNDPRGLAPEGWHIPTQAEFKTLGAAVNNNGNALKAIGQGSGDGAGTNTSGFSALLAGYRGNDGYFIGLGYYTFFWSSTEYNTLVAYYLYLFGNGSYVLLGSGGKADGFSVRCVKGVQPETQLQQQQSSSTQQPVQNNSDKTVKIGEQTWMSENLNVDHYRNGDAIPEVEDPAQWGNLKTGAWCYYDNKPENGKKYGKLYNWYAVNDPRGLVPKDWHIPTLEEFKTLGAAVNNNGNALKAFGFSALLAGFRNSNGYFANLGFGAYFWSSTETNSNDAFTLYLFTSDSFIYLNDYGKADGFSVRCVKGVQPETQLQQQQSSSTQQPVQNNSDKTVKIGEQTWMSENLNVDHYRNGDAIPEVEDPAQWGNLKTGAWCYYDNKPENGKKYGKLYNWYAVNDPRGLVPKDWHIPTLEEFKTLGAAVNNNGNALKAFGFSALLAGYRYNDGDFGSLGYYAYFWSSTETNPGDAYILSLYYTDSNIVLGSSSKADGFSVRCVKD